MNFTIDEVQQVIDNQSSREDGVRTMQLLLAEDWLELNEKLEEVVNEQRINASK